MMRCPVKRRERIGLCVVCLVAVLGMAGCGAPPSVEPLLKVTREALKREAQRFDADAEREAQYIRQTRESLRSAFRADLDQRDELTGEWVRQAAQAYVVAREELVRHAMRRQQQRARRRANLRAAAEAVQRARTLLQRQHELIGEGVGERVWRLLSDAAGESSS